MTDKAEEGRGGPVILDAIQPQIEEAPPPVPPEYRHVLGRRIRRRAEPPIASPTTCTVCGSALEPGGRYCTRCGAEIIEMIVFCPYCGRSLPPGGRYCDRCGRLVRRPAITLRIITI